jgi:hypothetical protein
MRGLWGDLRWPNYPRKGVSMGVAVVRELAFGGGSFGKSNRSQRSRGQQLRVARGV